MNSLACKQSTQKAERKTMKKKIAVFANGWSHEFIHQTLSSITDKAKENNMDVFLFMNYSACSDDERVNKGEFSIFKLPDLSEFDGCILFGNTFNLVDEVAYLKTAVFESKIPTVCIGSRMEGIDFIGSDNYSGMHDLVEHLISCHGVQNMVLVGGDPGHEDSRIRVQAAMDVAKEHGIEIPDDNLIYGQWYPIGARDAFAAWYQEHGHILPDAVICVNDDMALGVCYWAELYDVTIPDEMIVTGYDYTQNSRAYIPAITTVSKEHERIGEAAIQNIIDKLNQKETKAELMLDSKLQMGESCGCNLSQIDFKKRANLVKDLYHNRIGQIEIDGHYRGMAECAKIINDKKKMGEIFGARWEDNRFYQYDKFYVCLDPTYLEFEKEEEYKKTEFDTGFDVACALENRKSVHKNPIQRYELVPDYDGESSDSEVFIFVPIHRNDKTIGYVACSGNNDIIQNYEIYTWVQFFTQGLEQIRQNVRLEKLNHQLRRFSITDGLTGVYNRQGYNDMAYDFVKLSRMQDKDVVLGLIDINDMKRINDKYGHLQGDNACIAVARGLQKVVGKNGIPVRFGGDEFMWVCAREGDKTDEEVKKQIQSEISRAAREMEMEFEVGVSIGMVHIEENNPSALEKYVRIADENMYIEKQAYHNQTK